MEEILRKLQKEATGNKHKAIKDNCALAVGEYLYRVWMLTPMMAVYNSKPCLHQVDSVAES